MNMDLNAGKVGLNGTIKLTDATLCHEERFYKIRRMPFDRINEHHQRYNNMFFVVPGDDEQLYFQNSKGEKFVVLFRRLEHG